jgi:hypothetical protein
VRRGVLLITAATLIAAFVPPPARAQGVDQTCAFSLSRFDATTTNMMLLDTNAVYWGVQYAGVPGTRLRIEGEFPHARYTSWNLYDVQAKPVAGLTDTEIQPDPGSTNPLRPGANRRASKRRYTAFVEFAPKPANPRPNTIYAGDSKTGQLWLRIYVPDRGRDHKGGVPLPRITLEPASGKGGDAGIAACRQSQAPYPDALQKAIAAAPGLPDPTSNGDGYPGRNPPKWTLYTNLSRAVTDGFLDNETGKPLYGPAQQLPTNQSSGPGIFANRDISYVYTFGSRGFGDVLVIRGRAPTFANTYPNARVMPAGKQLRYFSFCQYEPISQRVIDCRRDDQVVVDRRGFYTVVIAAADQRPANATARCRVTWIPWGPQPHNSLIYRHMLANPGFAHAIQRVREPGRERVVMGDYYPSAQYLADKRAFEARGCPASP